MSTEKKYVYESDCYRSGIKMLHSTRQGALDMLDEHDNVDKRGVVWFAEQCGHVVGTVISVRVFDEE